MIDLNTNHPAFSMAMELLCLVPTYPRYAMIRDIAADLGLKGDKEVRELIPVLRVKGHKLSTRRTSRGNAISIETPESKGAAEMYYGRIYEHAMAVA